MIRALFLIGIVVAPMILQADTDSPLGGRYLPVMNLSEVEILALIPQRAGLRFTGCPNCEEGSQENQLAWTIQRPGEVFCRHCDIRYPNDRYPDDRILRVKNPTGKIQEYPYWDDADGYHHFFQAKGWYEAREYFADAARELGRAYAETGDAAYARRAALILNRFAEVYPGYCVHFDYPFRQKILFSSDQTFPYPVSDFRAAKWSWWAYMDIPEDLLAAYELILPSGVMDAATRNRIKTDLFRASVAFVRGYPPALSNMDPTLLRGLIRAGKLLKEPDYIHDAVDRIGALVSGQFFADGVWREGAVSYHRQTVNGLNSLIELLDGYHDPEGYLHPASGERFEDLDLAKRFPILAKAQRIPELLRYPNGRVVPFHDTWASEGGQPAEEVSGPLLLPALGQARLALGRGADQVQAHLHFSGGYGHQHGDVLAMTLFAVGQERLADIGYTHTRHRKWTISTLSHNTVMVDGRDQHMGSESEPSDGDLLLWVPGDGPLQAVEASGERAYPGTAQVYRRLLALVGVPDSEGDGYVIDIFRVQGGSRHEYVLVGDADHDGTLEHDLPASAYGDRLLPQGVSVKLPTGESVAGDAEGHNLAYAYIGAVIQAPASGTWMATFGSAAKPRGAVRVHGRGAPGDVLFTGTAPSVRRAGSDDGALDRFTMPVLVHRRQGEDLSSVFATVLEPVGERPFLSSVERLPAEDGAVAFRVTGEGDWEDYLIHSMTPGVTVGAGDLQLSGQLGFVRLRGGQVEQMMLVGGESLRFGEEEVRGEGVLTGRILGVLRRDNGDAIDGLITDMRVPEEVKLARTYGIVRDGAGFTHGCRIIGVQRRREETILVLGDDPGFAMEGGESRHLFFPGRAWTGENRIDIATVSVRGE
jgi:hypothetical protein